LVLGIDISDGRAIMASTKEWFESVAEAQRREARLPRSVYLALVAGAGGG